MQVLRTCMEVGALIKEQRLYAALQLLGKIREQHLGGAFFGSCPLNHTKYDSLAHLVAASSNHVALNETQLIDRSLVSHC